MVKGARVVRLGFVILVLTAGYGWPQEDILKGDEPAEEAFFTPPTEAAEEESGYQGFAVIKERIQVLLKENQALEAEYAQLKKEFLEVQDTAESYKEEIAVIEEELKQTEGTDNPTEIEDSPSLYARDGEHRANHAKQEAGTDIKEPPDIGQIKDLRQLQLYDLYYQKKELELELQENQASSQPGQEPGDAQTAVLRDELERNLEKEKELTRQAAELRQKTASYPEEIEQFKRENAELEDQVNALRRRDPRRSEKTAQGTTDSQDREKALEETARIDEENRQLRARIFMLRQGMGSPKE